MDEQDIEERINVDLIGGIILFHQVYLIKTILSKLLDKALYPRLFKKKLYRRVLRAALKVGNKSRDK